GVGSVLVFVPQIAILFFFLGLLEDSGYLARAAFLMDRIMRQVGLQGRSFIPLLSSFACAIPGILSTRTIPSFTDRLATILIAPLMSCSARLPVYTLLIAAFIPEQRVAGVISLQGLVLLAMYLLGVIAAAIVAWISKHTLLRGEPAIFVMEMPPFRMPSLILAAREAYDRIIIFLKSAGTIILSCSVVLWFLASYPEGPVEQSLAGRLGKTIEPVIEPLGFNWEIGVGIIASFAAREVFVTSLSTVYNLQSADDANHSITLELRERHRNGSFSLASALSLMVFYVFACQCISTLAVCRRETGTWFWPAAMFGYMTTLAYAAAFLTYRLMLG
ncbi:MAG: ferrous iron transporter B, partial [Oligoflexia bacterium]|nr:ferrous iron transporter B [Oligoflexia bacterium]